MYYLVYTTVNKKNGKFYIGSHRTLNINDGYLGSGKLIKKAIQKYSRQNFVRIDLHTCRSYEEMIAEEKRLTKQFTVNNKQCYNLLIGGGHSFKYINDNNLNNKSKQCYITAIKIKKDPNYAKWFSERVKEGISKRGVGGRNTRQSAKLLTKV